MKPLKNFDEFVKDGIVRKQSPDIHRSESLIKESRNAFEVITETINKVGITDKNANYFIKNIYDIVMEMIRAKMLLKGLNSAGLGAHEAEVAYLGELKFPESDVQFANQLRYFRNGIMYYGQSMDAEYAKKVIGFLKAVYPKLK